ncbi:MAG: hypothetical protein HYW48_01170 [Deltaproteobacteria bacterium]|nr:hypothetical protein [Deltaproteobacteria bacterium]
MSEHLIGAVGYGLAVLSTVGGIIFWFRQQSFLRAYQSLSKKWEDKKTEDQNLLKAMQTLQLANREYEKIFPQLERGRDELHKVAEGLRSELFGLKKEFAEERASLANQLEHVQSQADALMVQAKELDREKAELKLKAEAELRESKASSEMKINSLTRDINQTQKRLEYLEREKEQLSRQAGESGDKNKGLEEEVHRLRRKLSHYSHFFKVMRGQKEMLEERLENWERALQLLSAWIVKEKGGGEAQTLGELVASALHLTMQGSLVDDQGESEDLGG